LDAEKNQKNAWASVGKITKLLWIVIRKLPYHEARISRIEMEYVQPNECIIEQFEDKRTNEIIYQAIESRV
jgi:hypothetical protein